MLLVKMGPVSSRFVAVNYLAPLTRLPAINHRKPPRHPQHGRSRQGLSVAGCVFLYYVAPKKRHKLRTVQ